MSRLRLTYDNPQPINLTNQFTFGYIPEDKLIEIYKDGRAFSFLAEELVVRQFSGVLKQPKNTKGFDIIVEDIGKIEIKTFTKNGCKFMPSYMQGAGRSFDIEDFRNHINNIEGICIVDNYEFPVIYVVVKRAYDLALLYPNGSIPKSHRTKLFNLV